MKKYGNLFQMYSKITGADRTMEPMTIYPAVYYTMGGLWVDYNLMTTVPGLFALGEANFSDHGVNRLGSNALMQGLADGYFIAPATVAKYLAATDFEDVTTAHAAFVEARAESNARIQKLLVTDALTRTESCGCHFREESQTEENEARRDDDNFSHVSVWEYGAGHRGPIHHQEPLVFETVQPSQRNYR